MPADEIRRHSRWMMRAQEWDEPRARYPNVWHDEMPRHILAFTTVASRLRLGDLVAIYYPSSQRHPARSERFLGLSRVTGLRRSHDSAYAWVDMETEHRFAPPLDLRQAPRRVFLCCDPDWPDQEVDLFRKVFDAAVAAGWKSKPEDAEQGADVRSPVAAHEKAEPAAPTPEEPTGVEVGRMDEETAPAAEPVGAARVDEPETAATDAAAEEAEGEAPSADGDAGATPPEEVEADAPRAASEPTGRLFGGASFSGDMRDPREGTWLALLELCGDRLRLVRLEATGRGGLQGHLRDPDASLMHAEAIGLGFPFGVPLPFAESLLGGKYPEEGWWALARKLERMTRPDFLSKLKEFRDSSGELRRLTDEASGSTSPLNRSGPDLGSRCYQGIKLIAEERSRYAIRPFEKARGRLLLEVNPVEAGRRLGLLGDGESAEGRRTPDRVAALGALQHLPVEMDSPMRRQCQSRPAALNAVVAARCAVVAALSGEADRGPEELSAESSDRVRKEGWIYGLGEESPEP